MPAARFHRAGNLGEGGEEISLTGRIPAGNFSFYQRKLARNLPPFPSRNGLPIRSCFFYEILILHSRFEQLSIFFGKNFSFAIVNAIQMNLKIFLGNFVQKKKFFSESLYFNSINIYYFKIIQNHLNPFIITIYQDEHSLIP